MTAFNSKGRHEKLPTAVHVLQSTCDFVISNCAQVLQRNVQLELFKAWARNVKYNLLWLGIYISCYSCFTKLNFSLIIKRDILALPYYFDHAKWFFFVQRRGKGGGERPAFTLCWNILKWKGFSLSYKTNRFHVAVCLFSNRSQKTSKCGKNISDTLGYASCATCVFLSHFDVICDILLLNRRTATWNLFVKKSRL